jgi:hypothetical protein
MRHPDRNQWVPFWMTDRGRAVVASTLQGGYTN